MNTPAPSKFIVSGPAAPLTGELAVPGCKNSAMPILVASALSGGEIRIRNVPQIRDMDVLRQILVHLNVTVNCSGADWRVQRGAFFGNDIPAELSRRLRGSVYALAPLAAFVGSGTVGPIGGDAISGRSLAPHARVLAGFGIDMQQCGAGWALSGRPAMRGEFSISDQGISATALAILIAATIHGETVIHEASLEIECDDVLEAVRRLGAQAWREGRTVVVKGPMSEHPATVSVRPDHLVWGTFAIAAAITGGSLTAPAHLAHRAAPIIHMLNDAGIDVQIGNELTTSGSPRFPFRVTTGMFPLFPSDLLPQAMVLSSLVDGESTFVERHYGARFDHVPEFGKLGGTVSVSGMTALVHGGRRLSGTTVMGAGIRESTALVLAGLAAEGKTVVHSAQAVHRGYEDLCGDLCRLGAELSMES